MSPQKNITLKSLFQIFVDDQPVGKLIRKTAKEQWRLILVNIISSICEAVSEGLTLAIIYFAVDVISASDKLGLKSGNGFLVGIWPVVLNVINQLSRLEIFMILLSLAVLMQLLQSFSRFLNLVTIGYFAARCRALVTVQIHRQILSLSYSSVSQYKVGDLAEYASQGPEAIRIQIQEVNGILVHIMLSVIYLFILIKLSLWLLIAVIILGIFIILVQNSMLPRIQFGSRALTDAQVSIASRITEDFQALRLLHVSGQLEHAQLGLFVSMSKLENILRGQARRLSLIEPFSSFLPIVAIAIISALSLVAFGANQQTILPSLVAFVLALKRLNEKLTRIAEVTNQLVDNSGRINRLNQILSPVGKSFRRIGGKPFGSLQRSIVFDNVTLNYCPMLEPALQDLCFEINKGEMIALVGPSGAGKSSIADLLTGLYPPSAGKIYIDNISLDELSLNEWQMRLGVVSQDTFLFNASIASNISFGLENKSFDEIRSACVAAQASDFIENLPEGYNTVVGERGYRLSGGQRQRLALARAILRSPELLILDEATSALDSQSELLVQQAIEQFSNQHTILVIAHRLSTIINADQIYVLDKGRIVEFGTHGTLRSRGGMYAQLWEHQGGFGQNNS